MAALTLASHESLAFLNRHWLGLTEDKPFLFVCELAKEWQRLCIFNARPEPQDASLSLAEMPVSKRRCDWVPEIRFHL